MTAKIEFFYTHGHTYTATGVESDSITYDNDYVQYVSYNNKENLDIQSTNLVSVKKHDLKFAIITYSADDQLSGGSTVIIHGLAEKFEIGASYDETVKIRKLEEQERLAKESTEYKRQREHEKFVKRREKRSASRKEQYSK